MFSFISLISLCLDARINNERLCWFVASPTQPPHNPYLLFSSSRPQMPIKSFIVKQVIQKLGFHTTMWIFNQLLIQFFFSLSALSVCKITDNLQNYYWIKKNTLSHLLFYRHSYFLLAFMFFLSFVFDYFELFNFLLFFQFLSFLFFVFLVCGGWWLCSHVFSSFLFLFCFFSFLLLLLNYSLSCSYE